MGIPLGQVQITETVNIYEAPQTDIEPMTRVRRGDVLLIYEIDDQWGRSDWGWLILEGLSLQPAVVHYSAVMDHPIEISRTMEETPFDELQPDETVGVVAIFQGWALLYTRDRAGWARLDQLALTEPHIDLITFVERRAYIKVESTDFYALPDAENMLSTHPLGAEVIILTEDGDWILAKTNHTYGWSLKANFDILPGAVTSGTMNDGPVFLRAAPVDGRMITRLYYGNEVVIFGQDATGEWLYVRSGQYEGWVSAFYVNFEGELPLWHD